jgi:alkanesulfonate monooxygenase SsuD/methylene tetrahydromethanopterin reductase-like flavin-dependent oxidoreductase (luciferase family)
VPLWGSGINPTMLKLAARAFDGVALHPIAASIKYLDDIVCPALEDGAAGRSVKPEIALWRITSVNPDESLAIAKARRSLAFYFSTPSYGSVADYTGWGQIASDVRDAYRERGPAWDDIQSLIPDEMIDEFCLVGTPENVRARWESTESEYAARGVTEAVFQIVTSGDETQGTPEDFLTIIDSLAPGEQLAQAG